MLKAHCLHQKWRIIMFYYWFTNSHVIANKLSKPRRPDEKPNE